MYYLYTTTIAIKRCLQTITKNENRYIQIQDKCTLIRRLLYSQSYISINKLYYKCKLKSTKAQKPELKQEMTTNTATSKIQQEPVTYARTYIHTLLT